MTNPLSHPEAQAVFDSLLGTLGKESDRGMILIGAVHVDDSLGTMFERVFNPTLSKRVRNRLLKYPGPLSTFAARSDMAYALRLIPHHVYLALGALRELRNELAHKSTEFTLQGLEDRYQKIYALGPNVPAGIRSMAIEMMMELKVSAALEAYQELQRNDPDLFKEDWTSDDVLKYFKDKPDVIAQLNKQLVHWELAIGISMLASMIIYHRDKALEALGSTELLSNIGRASVTQTDELPANPTAV